MNCKFPNQSRDILEKYYSMEIQSNFPNYGVFWEKFIGIRFDNDSLLPYGLLFAGSRTQQDKDKCRNAHSRISSSHYACFCHLISAHKYFEDLKNLNHLDKVAYHLNFWRYYESSYLHLGAAWQDIIQIWELLLKELPSKKILKKNQKTRDYIVEYLIRNDLSLKSDLDTFQKEIVDYRNIIAHCYRLPSQIDKDKYLIPSNFNISFSFYDYQTSTSFTDATTKLKNDLGISEIFFNKLHIHLISLYEQMLTSEGIAIAYDSGQSDTFCPKCNFYLLTKYDYQIIKKDSTILGTSSYTSSVKLNDTETFATAYLDSAKSSLVNEGDGYILVKCGNPICVNFYGS